MLSENDQSLLEVSEGGDAEGVKRLLKAGANPLAKDGGGMTALMRAAQGCSAECVRELLPVSDALAVNNDGYTALMRAAYSGSAECVRELLPVSGALAVNNDGWSALMWAALSCSAECVRELLPESEALAVNSKGETAFDLAQGSGHQEIAGLLWVSEEAQVLRNAIGRLGESRKSGALRHSPRL